VENAVRRWQGQFRTIKSHVETELGGEIPREHPVLQWMAVWSAGVLNRVPIRSHGRTVYEFVTGHRMKVPMAIFGEAVMWRRKRHSGALNKYDSEWADGVYLGIAGLSTEAIIGTSSGVVRTNEFRVSPDGKWNRELVLSIPTSFQDYIDPENNAPKPSVILPVPTADLGPGVPATEIQARRMRLVRRDFLKYGYTGGCPGCIHLQSELEGSRNHNEACRLRIEGAVANDEQEAARKAQADARLDGQLTRALEREEELLNRPVDPAAPTEGELPALGPQKFAIDTPVPGSPDSKFDESLPSAERDEDMDSPISLHSPPRRTGDVRIATPAADTHMVVEPEELVSGPSSSTEVSATATRRPAIQNRALTPEAATGHAGPSDQVTKRTKITTQAHSAVDDRPPAVSRTLQFGNDASDKRLKTTSDDMLMHFEKMQVYPDDERQQHLSCVLHGFVHNNEDMKIMSMMLSGVDITEVYSPARVVKLCGKYGLVGGDSFDLRTGYDLADPATQARVVRHLQREKPKLVIGSPPCTLFSRLQALNLHTQGPEWKAEFEKRRVQAVAHIEFCIRLFRLQRNRGDYFLFEHPESADSWNLPIVQEFLQTDGVQTSVVDQCMYGLLTRGSTKDEKLPAKKPTRFASNSWFILQELSTRCDGSHVHQPLVGGRAAGAAEYPDGLCEAFCRGLAGQLAYDRAHRVCTGVIDKAALHSMLCVVDNARAEETALSNPVDGLTMSPTSGSRNLPGEEVKYTVSEFPPHWRDRKHEPDGTAHDTLAVEEGQEAMPEERNGYFRIGINDGEQMLKMEMNALMEKYDATESWDDVSGAPLIVGLVRAARKLEMKFFEKMGVFAEVLHRSEVKKRGEKTIRGRWIDTNKGDSACPDYRSRFVGKEFNVGVDPELFAATPPLEALKLLLGYASSNRSSDIHLMFSDVKRAYFNAKAQRNLWVDLPEEHEGYFPGAVGRLALALYGTRDAAMLWQECLAEHLIGIGFKRGIANPCIYYNESRQLRCLVHGDDYATAGAHRDLVWMQGELEKRFEMKSTMVGHSSKPGVAREGKYSTESCAQRPAAGNTSATRDTLKYLSNRWAWRTRRLLLHPVLTRRRPSEMEIHYDHLTQKELPCSDASPRAQIIYRPTAPSRITLSRSSAGT
jgi:hypothetical protein